MSQQLQITGTASFSQNVGIGTTTAQTLLSIENSGVLNVVSPIITSQTAGVTYAGMYSIKDGAGDQRGLLFQNYTANVGLTEKFRIASTGAATFSGVGNRPVTIDGNVNIKADSGGWAMQHGFIGSLGTERGGFGAYGTADTLNYYYIGIYGAEKMIITNSGNVLIGTTTDSGQLLQVNGITKTVGLSLSGTTASTSQTITSAFYMWIFNGASGQTLTLYSPSGHNNTHFIKNSSANSLTLATSGNNIETLTSTTAVSSITIPAFKTVQVISNGGGVWIVMYQS